MSPLDLKASLCGSEIQECPSTFHSWYWKERQDTLQSTHLFSYGKNWCWLQLVLTSLKYSTSINRTIHKFEAQYSLKAFTEDKHSSVILFLNWGSPQMVLLCMTLSGQTQQQRFLCLCGLLILSESSFVAWLHSLINSHITCFVLSDSYRNSLDILLSALPPDGRCSLVILPSPLPDPLFPHCPQVTQCDAHSTWCRQFNSDVLLWSGCTHRREIIIWCHIYS